MLKIFDLWTRAQDVTASEAISQAIDDAATNVPLLHPSVLRWVTNVGISTDVAPPFDAIGEGWIAGGEESALEQLARQPTFVGTHQLMVADTAVHVDRGRRHAGVKSMFLLTRRPGMTRAEAVAYWRGHHAPLVARTFGDRLVRYSTNVGLPTDINGWPDECSPFDGVAELWLDLDVEQMFAFISDVADILVPDERAFCGTYRIFLADERVHRGNDALLPA